MAIKPEAYAKGHHYKNSPMGGAVWCYKHDVPTFPCDFDDEEDDYTEQEYRQAWMAAHGNLEGAPWPA